VERKAVEGILFIICSTNAHAHIIHQMDPDLLLDFLPRLKAYLGSAERMDADGEDNVGNYLSDLIQFLETEYASQLWWQSSCVKLSEYNAVIP
jgi:hypothetical protein